MKAAVLLALLACACGSDASGQINYTDASEGPRRGPVGVGAADSSTDRPEDSVSPAAVDVAPPDRAPADAPVALVPDVAPPVPDAPSVDTAPDVEPSRPDADLRPRACKAGAASYCANVPDRACTVDADCNACLGDGPSAGIYCPIPGFGGASACGWCAGDTAPSYCTFNGPECGARACMAADCGIGTCMRCGQ